MNIIKPEIKWSGDYQRDALNLSAVDGIALHHMAHPSWDFYDVHAFHRDSRQWWGIGYNFWIGFDGTVYEGRGFSKGAGVADHNDHLINIGFQGNFEPGQVEYQTEMTDEQYDAGVELIAWLKTKCPNIRIVHGHKYWVQTACPGKHFPLTEMVAGGKRRVSKPESGFSDVSPEDWFYDCVKAVSGSYGFMKGYEDGTFQPNRPLTRAEMAKILNDLIYWVENR